VRKALFVALVFAAIPAFAQLESHTLTVTATRQITLQPDQVVLSLTVNASPTTTVDQVVAALAGLGITSANLSGLNHNSAPQLQWTFTLALPLSNLTGTIGALNKLQQSITQNNSGLTLMFSVNGPQVSAQLRQSQSCTTSDLIADATAQAQKLAAAAGMTIGPILGVSDVSSPQPSLAFAEREVAPASSFIGAGFALVDIQLPTPPVTCSLTVEFQLQP